MSTSTHAISTQSTWAAQSTVGTLKSWWDAYWMHRAQRATVMMLSALDDRGLHDIGLDRSEIESVIYGKPGDRTLRYQQPVLR